MATPTYSQSDFYSIVNGMMHNKFAQVNDRQVISNRAVRDVLSEVDIRSTKRSAQLSPNMFEDQFDYASPSDLKMRKIIDLRKQVSRPSSDRWTLVDEPDFDRLKYSSNRRIAVRDENFSQILRIDGLPNSKSQVIHSCDSLTTNGTWAVVAGTDATNLTLDSLDYITGGGSLNFDASAGIATAAIENSTMTAVDLTDYDEKSSLFVWVFIPDYSDAEADTVTNFILRWGNDSSNYWSRTVTTNNEGLTFYDGWNLLRFDWNGATETGTVDPAAIDYVRFTVTKSTSLAADTDWRVDNIMVSKGEIYNVVYYSKYGWQNSGGSYIEESSATTDLLIADVEEVELYATRAAELAAQELKEKDDLIYFRDEYKRKKSLYQKKYPSEALRIQRRYTSFNRNW